VNLDNLDNKLRPLLFVKVENLKTRFHLKVSFCGWKPDLLKNKLSALEEKLLLCSNCHGIMRDAVFYGKVSTCRVCLSSDVRDSAFDNDTARDIINQSQIKCPLSEDGCDWTGAIQSLTAHFSSCLCYPVTCP
ncbi:hypothetical protein, partial [Salmonella sp. s51228]|uniref:hypothetical protein n=1 Tax=Salmonella sp. s51228 TaxID=3159652 RepID=UPI003980E284